MGRGREGKIRLIKNNVLGDDNVVGGEIKTPITFVVSGVSKKNTSGGLVIGGGDSIEGEVWTGRTDRLGGEVIQ
jgi:hypothetical protein